MQDKQFVRHCLTKTGVFESLCLRCGSTVAYSPDMRALDIAEASHICKADKANAADKAAIAKQG